VGRIGPRRAFVARDRVVDPAERPEGEPAIVQEVGGVGLDGETSIEERERLGGSAGAIGLVPQVQVRDRGTGFFASVSRQSVPRPRRRGSAPT